MSLALRVKHYRFALVLAKRFGCYAFNLLHTTSTARKELEIDIQQNIVATGSMYLKGDREKLKQNIIDRRTALNTDILLATADDYEKCQMEIRTLKRERKMLNARVIKEGQDVDQNVMLRAAELKIMMKSLQEQFVTIEKRYFSQLSHLPNSTHPDVPVGGYGDSRLVYTHGSKPEFSFPVLNHLALGEKHDLVDFERARYVTGRNFYYLKGAAALLEIALIQYTIQKAVSKGYHPISAPDIVKVAAVQGCGFNPKTQASEVYWLDNRSLCLTGTAEIPLAGMFYAQLLPLKELPMKFVAFGRCFRPESGGYGHATRGLYRVHQFSKVELFGWTSAETEEESEHMLQEMVDFQKEVMEELGLHYRVLEMATEELGAPAYHKYDLEAWMPGRDEYGEVCSASNCTDFQSRRLDVTYHNPGYNYDKSQPKCRYPHSVNATACAVPRIIIALLESHQEKDGSVVIPEVLHAFLPQSFRYIRPLATSMPRQPQC